METLNQIVSIVLNLLPLILMTVSAALAFRKFYRTMKKKTQYKKARNAKIGDKAVTVKGLEGTVVAVGEDTVDLEFNGHCASFVYEAIKEIA